MIKAVIFDMDGVLVNSEPLYRIINDEYFANLGFSVSDELYSSFVGLGASAMWQILIDRYNLTRSAVEYIEEKRAWKIRAFSSAQLDAIEHIPQLLSRLQKKGIKIGLASSSGRDVIEIVLTKAKIKQYFEVIVSGEDVQNGKPAPDIFLKAATLLGQNPTDCAILEDSKNGVAAGKSAGMFTIGYKNPDSGNQDISAADVIIEQIEECFDILKV